MTDRLKRIIIIVVAAILLIAVVSFVASRLFGGQDDSAQTSQTRSADNRSESEETSNTPAQSKAQQSSQDQPGTQGAQAGGSSTALTNSGPGETAALLFVVAFVAGTAIHQVVSRTQAAKS